MSKHTVAIVTPYFPPQGGGLERYAKEIATRLHAGYPYKIIVITSGVRDEVEQEGELVVYRVRRTFTFSNTPFSFVWFYKIWRILHTENVELINIHTPVAGIGNVAALVAGKRKVVVTYHAGSMRKGRAWFDTLVWLYEQGPLRVLLSRADHIVATSSFLLNTFLLRYSNKASIIEPAVDTSIFRPDTPIRSKVPTLLFVAGLSRSEQYKGLYTLLEALPEIKKSIPELRLCVVGEGNMREEYEAKVAAHGLGGAVQFLGRLAGDELRAAYQYAWVLVHPTRIDNYPLVILEAMATGLPVVSTQVGGIPELIANGETGVLVEPGDKVALAQAVIQILIDPEIMSHMGGVARAETVRKHTWEDRTEKYHKVYSALVERAIVHITAYYPPHVGGVERVAEVAARMQAARGTPVVVLTSNNMFATHVSQEGNLTVKRLASIDFAHTPFALSLPWHLLCMPKNSLIHVHLTQAWWADWVWLIAPLRRIPYIAHFHLDVEPSGFFGGLFVIYKKILWGSILRCAERVIVCASEQIDIVQRVYDVPIRKILVIPNAVGEEFFNEHTNAVSPKLRLLSVGRLAPQKRIDRLIDAMSELSIPATLTIVGDGEERANLEALCADRNLQNVSFVGSKNPQEIQSFFAGHDVFLISSDKEGLPLTVLEAMAAGMPVIGANVIGIRELIADVGMLVDPPFTEGFARAIEALSGNPTLQAECAARSRDKAKQYAWPEFEKKLRDVYEQVS